MDADTAERIRDWSSRSVSGGHDALRTLADEEFTGAVSLRDTWLFMLNGRIIGIVDGTLESVSDADGTVYAAPDPSLPLLFAMQEAADTETRSKYYTEDTPLDEVHSTLSEGGFTGYIELSEDVLSGDYYIAYYGGRSLPAAFVGNRNETVTGDEAYDLAADEVGIYEVLRADVTVTDVPPPVEPAQTESDDTDQAHTETDDDQEDDISSQTGQPSVEEEQPADGVATEDSTSTEPSKPPEESSSTSGTAADSYSRQSNTQTESRRDDPSTGESSTPSGDQSRSQTRSRESDDPEAKTKSATDEKTWQETRVVPALDPNASSAGTRSRAGGTTSEQGGDGTPAGVGVPQSQDTRAQPQSETLREELSRLESELDATRKELDSVKAERDELLKERNELADDNTDLESLREERDALQERVATLEDKLAEARASVETDQTAETDISADHALSGTNVFVRYDTKGQPTLADVPAGANREQVDANLRLDIVTRFDTEDATVDGAPFEQYLRQTSAWRFVTWVVRELPYEIRDTGREDSLSTLYNVLSDIDRAEFDGTVEVETEEGSNRAEYDVVLRGRKGDPLIVADIDDSRDPVTGEEMGSLIDRTSRIHAGAPTVGAAISVTASFFQPEALETAEDATGGGLFSRGSKASFVRQSRKEGYHLCLVEAREDSFYVTVPEL